MATDKASPSFGSVPFPSSSITTKSLLEIYFKITEIVEMWALNVDKLLSIDWLSPISI